VTPQQQAGRDALITYLVVLAAVAGLMRINVTLPAIGHLGSALVSVVFLYAPIVVLGRRDQDIADYGFRIEPLKKGLATAAVALLVIFPVFVVGFFGFYEIACKSSLLATVLPKGTCAAYHGLDAIHAPKVLNREFIEFCLVQWLVVALPEELFFRGFMQGLLEQRFPPTKTIFGAKVGIALVLSSLAFACVHLPKGGDPRMLATFFPSLMFGWMRARTNSILASTITHGASNILIRLLNSASMR